eukprot:958440-Prorocentrum_lima.AAC.1
MQEGHCTSCGVPLPLFMHPSFHSGVLSLGACKLRFLVRRGGDRDGNVQGVFFAAFMPRHVQHT